MAMPKGPKCGKCTGKLTKRKNPVPHYFCNSCGLFARMVAGYSKADLDAAIGGESDCSNNSK